MEIDNNMLMGAGALGTIAVCTALLKFHGLLQGYIKQASRPAEPEKVKIQQPLRTVLEKEVLTREEHKEHCGQMERRVTALEARTDRIERKMEADKIEILAAGESRAEKIHCLQAVAGGDDFVAFHGEHFTQGVACVVVVFGDEYFGHDLLGRVRMKRAPSR